MPSQPFPPARDRPRVEPKKRPRPRPDTARHAQHRLAQPRDGGAALTREEIEREYNVIDGIIRRLGKFEGNAVYVPHFWDIAINGFADNRDGSLYSFDVKDGDRAMFPELNGRRTVKLLEIDVDGFVLEVY